MFQAPRGTQDILPMQQPWWRHVTSSFEQTAGAFGYERIDTPLVENTLLFQRTIGKDTDVVNKEMYSFTDRGRQSLTLRPEGTAAVCRAYLEHGMHNHLQPARLSYISAMFRYDRPQSGRYRQFHQYGVEAIGDPDPALDVEVIQLAMETLSTIGLAGMTLVLNTIGDPSDRPAYLRALHDYYSPYLDRLSRDDRWRLKTNPMRLLDSKEPATQLLSPDAPRTVDYLGPAARAHWETVIGLLDDLDIPYHLDHRLVRGLDYYSRTVFEVIPQEEGSQNTICAGGRYDGLIAEMGGPVTPGVGFAAGIERIVLNLQRQATPVPQRVPAPVVVVYRGTEGKRAALRLATQIRSRAQPTIVAPDRSLRAQMRYANTLGAAHVYIVGNAELARGIVTVREMATGQQREVPLTLLDYRRDGR